MSRVIKIRCKWCNLDNSLYVKYHDEEWCQLNLDDNYLFEMLLLESFQAGLSWECVLNKREDFRKAYDNFNLDKICKSIRKEYGSFRNYLKTFTNEEIIYEIDKTTNLLSDSISKDLKKRGMKFVGSVIIYSYLQAIGIIYSHDKECFLYKKK